MTALVNDEILPANERYATDFAKGALPMPPGRACAVVTCMDAPPRPCEVPRARGGRRARHPKRRRHRHRRRAAVARDSHHLLGTEEGPGGRPHRLRDADVPRRGRPGTARHRHQPARVPERREPGERERPGRPRVAPAPGRGPTASSTRSRPGGCARSRSRQAIRPPPRTAAHMRDRELDGFLALLATRRAPRTVEAYRRDLAHVAERLGKPLGSASTDDLRT